MSLSTGQVEKLDDEHADHIVKNAELSGHEADIEDDMPVLPTRLVSKSRKRRHLVLPDEWYRKMAVGKISTDHHTWHLTEMNVVEADEPDPIINHPIQHRQEGVVYVDEILSPSEESTKEFEYTEEDNLRVLADASYSSRKHSAYLFLVVAFESIPQEWKADNPEKEMPPSLLSFFAEFEDFRHFYWCHSQKKMVETMEPLLKQPIENAREDLLKRLLKKIHRVFQILFFSKIKRLEYNTLKRIIQWRLLLVDENEPAEKIQLEEDLVALEVEYAQQEHPETESDMSE